MSNFKVITFDVEHGNCHILRTPSDLTIMIDAGSKADFSPALHLKRNWSVEQLYWLTVSHQDSDHVTDIKYVEQYIRPRLLERPTITEQKLRELKSEIGEPLEDFLKFEQSYKVPAPPMGDPSYDWGGVQFATFNNKLEDLEQENINDLSIVTFAHYMGWGFIFPGDLEEQGWLKLLQEEAFRDQLSKVDIFIASHHGRESGFCSKVFEICTPRLIIVSDKGSVETSITDRYCQASRGLSVTNDKTGEKQTRYVLSTRADGAIYVDIDGEGRYSVKAGYSY